MKKVFYSLAIGLMATTAALSAGAVEQTIFFEDDTIVNNPAEEQAKQQDNTPTFVIEEVSEPREPLATEAAEIEEEPKTQEEKVEVKAEPVAVKVTTTETITVEKKIVEAPKEEIISEKSPEPINEESKPTEKAAPLTEDKTAVIVEQATHTVTVTVKEPEVKVEEAPSPLPLEEAYAPVEEVSTPAEEAPIQQPDIEEIATEAESPVDDENVEATLEEVISQVLEEEKSGTVLPAEPKFEDEIPLSREREEVIIERTVTYERVPYSQSGEIIEESQYESVQIEPDAYETTEIEEPEPVIEEERPEVEEAQPNEEESDEEQFSFAPQAPTATANRGTAFMLDERKPLPTNLLENDSFAPSVLNKQLSYISPEQRVQMIMKKKYDEMDVNGDGVVSAEEFIAFKTDEATNIAEEVFKRVDADGDGILSMEEYDQLMSRMVETVKRQAQIAGQNQ